MKQTEAPLSNEFLGKLARYSALAGAAGLGGSLAEAGITVWSPGLSIQAASGGTASIYFDFESGTTQNSSFIGADFRLMVSNSSSSNYFYAKRLGTVNLVQGSTSSVARLASGQQVNATQSFSTNSSMASGSSGGSVWGDWSAGGQGYLGFQFDIGGSTHYGWADVTLENISPDVGMPKMTLNRFAYNTASGEGLLAGQTVIPEPESVLPMALLALGAAGLTRYRRQRAAGNQGSER